MPPITPRLVRRPVRRLRLPDLALMGLRVAPYVLGPSEPGYYEISVEYTIDMDDRVLALHLFLRDALPGEVAQGRALIARAPDPLPEAIGALGLPALHDRGRVDDRVEVTLTLYDHDLVLGVFVTATQAALTDAALDFAVMRLIPLFMEQG